MNDRPIKIDESLARGLFRQEVREGSRDILIAFDDVQKSRPADEVLINDILEEHLFRNAKRKGQFSLSSFSTIARALKNYKCGPCEEIHQLTAKVVNSSANKSYLEVAFRNRPFMKRDILSCGSIFRFAKKDRLVSFNRIYPITIYGHAIRRYLQRGDLMIGDAVLAPVLAELYKRSGLLIFLANIAGRSKGSQFSVPFKSGLLLCQTHLRSVAGSLSYTLPTGHNFRGLTAKVRHHSHPIVWGSEQDTSMEVVANTFIGQQNLKDRQKELRDLLEGTYERYKTEIDLIGEVLNSFYPTHLPDVENALDAAGARLDEATAQVVHTLSANRHLSYAFNRQNDFDDTAVQFPSKAIAHARQHVEKIPALRDEMGIVMEGGGLFCHIPLDRNLLSG